MTINEIRQSTGLSQGKFADRYHLPVRTLQQWEQGRRSCPEYVIYLLSKVVEEDMRMKDTVILWTSNGHDEWYERFSTEAEAQAEADNCLKTNKGWKAEVQHLSDYDEQMQEVIKEEIL